VSSGLVAVLVPLVHSRFAIIKNVLTIVAAVRRPRVITPAVPVSITKRTVKSIWPHNHDPATSLRLNRTRGQKRHPGEHQRRENDAANLSKIFSFHFVPLNLLIPPGYSDAF